MSCTRPLTAFYDGIKEDGKRNIVRISSAHDDDNEYALSRGWMWTRIPCGQCAMCRMQRSREWANRIFLENELHDHGYFVTLTYSDWSLLEHEPSCSWMLDKYNLEHHGTEIPERNIQRCLSYASDPDTGELVRPSISLNKRDFQLFMKRLRKRFPEQKIRFYMCGEYGSETARPHFHVILWCDLPEIGLLPYKKTELGYDLMTSVDLADLWPYGTNIVAPVTWESACYVARYVMKKYTGPEGHVYTDNGLLPPFTLMSRRPGIAADAYSDQLFENEYIVRPSAKPGKVLKFKPPKYLENIFADLHPDEAKQRSILREKCARHNEKIVLSRTDKGIQEYYAAVEKNFDKANDLLYYYRNKV